MNKNDIKIGDIFIWRDDLPDLRGVVIASYKMSFTILWDNGREITYALENLKIPFLINITIQENRNTKLECLLK